MPETSIDSLLLQDARVERLIRSLVRSRLVFQLLAFVVPACLYGLFERQARRLDSLGDHGAQTNATVTSVSRDGSVFYAYGVGGTTYTWSVAQRDAPYPVGGSFAITYVSEDPALS
jgi:hypothetical protein